MSSQTFPTAPAADVRRRASWRASRLELDTYGIATYEAGRSDPFAPVLVLVHGMGHGTQAAWSFVAAGFEETHRIVAFDLPGFGASDKPDLAYTLPFFTSVLREVVRTAGLSKFALAGHSLGGLIAAEYASRYPAKVRHLTLIAPAGFLRTPALVLRVMGSGPVMRVLGAFRPSRGFARRTARNAVFDPASMPAEDAERVIDLALDPASTRAFLRVYAGAMNEMVHMRALHARFSGRRAPTLIVWGRQDRFVPVRALVTARAIYPEAEVLELDRCGHIPSIEYPEAVIERMHATGA
jgi:pimeloyl-ACP methyl ester carboxylesterase